MLMIRPVLKVADVGWESCFISHTVFLCLAAKIAGYWKPMRMYLVWLSWISVSLLPPIFLPLFLLYLLDRCGLYLYFLCPAACGHTGPVLSQLRGPHLLTHSHLGLLGWSSGKVQTEVFFIQGNLLEVTLRFFKVSGRSVERGLFRPCCGSLCWNSLRFEACHQHTDWHELSMGVTEGCTGKQEKWQGTKDRPVSWRAPWMPVSEPSHSCNLWRVGKQNRWWVMHLPDTLWSRKKQEQ